MKVLYIGHYNEGSTSRMRGEYLKELLAFDEFLVINIDIPFEKTGRIFKSLGWRYKVGPLIENINNHIVHSLKGNYSFDLVWIDKGVFIKPEIIYKLRKSSSKLIHFTPDPAFTYHKSKLFYRAIHQYDYCITTKSYELNNYKKYGVKTIFCTQGFDPKVHKPYNSFEDKNGLIFVGHREDEREWIIAKLIEAKNQVTIAGNHWNKFVTKYRNSQYLIYKGTGIFGDQYAREISKARIGLGFLSKWVPELHTTRTFEIPACGTALVSEKNDEISSIYTDEEVIYANTSEEILSNVVYYMNNPEKLKKLTERGYKKVLGGGYSYIDILKKIIRNINE